jgi:hypothetical protein
MVHQVPTIYASSDDGFTTDEGLCTDEGSSIDEDDNRSIGRS